MCLEVYIFKSHVHSRHGPQILKVATDAVTSYSAFFPRALHSETPEHRYDNANSRPSLSCSSVISSLIWGGGGGKVRLKMFNQSISLTDNGLFSVLNSNLSNPAIAF